MRKQLITVFFLLPAIISQAQDSAKQTSALQWSGYIETYYSYDFNKPYGNSRLPFAYSHNRHNEFNINLAYIKAAYAKDQVRANLALATGTYISANYAAEPNVLKNVLEANVGVKLSRKSNLWLDAGVFPSHIGFESAISSTCTNLTRSIIADNSPYFESGAKLTYTTDNKHWVLSVMALNGWQRIQRLSGNSLMSWGTQVQYIPSDKVTLNYSTFLGTDQPDNSRRFRHFHNLYGIFTLSKKVQAILGADIGQEQTAKGSSRYNTWYGTAAIIQVSLPHQWRLAARGEYYNDVNSVIVTPLNTYGFKTSGASVNIDKKIGDNVLWRAEIRTLMGTDQIFATPTGFSRNNSCFTTSLAVTF